MMNLSPSAFTSPSALKTGVYHAISLSHKGKRVFSGGVVFLLRLLDQNFANGLSRGVGCKNIFTRWNGMKKSTSAYSCPSCSVWVFHETI